MVVLLLFTSSCTQEDKLTDEPLVEADADTDTDTDTDTDAVASLADIEDHSVNRASVALDGELGALRAEGRSETGDSSLYLNLVVDLACDGSALVIAVVDVEGFAIEDLAEGYASYAADPDAEQWRAVGGLDDILPGHLESDRGRLVEVVEAYPEACLRDADTLDGGMPAGVVTRSVLWVLGDSSNTEANGWTVRSLGVGEDVLGAP